MTIAMFDSILVDTLPLGALAYAGYVDGNWPTYNTLKTKFPHANILSIAVQSNANAQCLDVETGDASPAGVVVWVARQIANKVYRPVLYANASTMVEIISLVDLAGINRNDIRLWSAHYTYDPHFCGPHTCGLLPIDVDGTQWTDMANGINLDESILDDDFFAAKPTPTPKPSPTPTPPSWQTKMMNTLPTLRLNDNDAVGVWYVHRVQSILNNIFGYPLVMDGIYGPATESAVRWLEGKYGLKVDGQVTANVWSVLYTGSK